jgi:hypothetical protein
MFNDLWGAVSPYASAVAKAASEVALQLRSGDPSADEGEHSIFEFEEDAFRILLLDVKCERCGSALAGLDADQVRVGAPCCP